jgi:hypothetical protein
MRLTTRTKTTAREIVRDFALSHDSWRAAAAVIGITESLLRAWVLIDSKSLRPKAALHLAGFFKLPLEAIYRKDEPIGPIVRELRPIVCDRAA